MNDKWPALVPCLILAFAVALLIDRTVFRRAPRVRLGEPQSYARSCGGIEVPDGALFCPGCGEPLEASSARGRTPLERWAIVYQLDVWTALGGDVIAFHEWRDGRSGADAWAQLLAAVEGDQATLEADTNPPAGALLDLVRARR